MHDRQNGCQAHSVTQWSKRDMVPSLNFLILRLFRERLRQTRSIGVGTRKNESALREDLFRQIADLQDDNVQLCEGKNCTVLFSSVAINTFTLLDLKS